MRAKKIHLLPIWALLIFTMVSCQSKDFDTTKASNGGFKLTYTVQGSHASTYANVPAEPGENDINGLWLLFFERTSGGTGTFIEAYKVDAQYPLSMNETTLNINFPGGSVLNNTTAYNILAVTNLKENENINVTVEAFLQLLEGKTENEVVTSTLTNVFVDHDEIQPNYNHYQIPTSNLMMSGRTTVEANQQDVSLVLQRTVSRIDVQNQAVGFQLRSVSIWNGYPNAPIWGGGFSSFTAPRHQRLYGVNGITSNENKGQLYTLENSVGAPQATDAVTTCLIIGIQKDGDAFTTFYRVNLTPPDMGQQLRRNNSYNLIIRNVLGEGANTEMDAYLSAKFLLNYTINSWFVDDRGNIQFDGDRILAVPTTNIVFTPLAETRVFNIFTQGEGTLEISQSELPVGFTATLSGNDLTVSVVASEVTQSGFIELRFGTLRSVINISQTGASQPVLLLSRDQVPLFALNPGVASPPITVTSSGSWKATIYNGKFTFGAYPGLPVTEITGNTGDSFVITTTNSNGDPNPWVSFVLVTLDSDPTITRTLVLAQQGVGGITLTPNVSAVDFDVFGASINNLIEIETESNAPWEVITSGLHASRFTITEDHVTLPNSITITAQPNDEPNLLTASVRIRLVNSPTIFKDITLTQQRHTLTLNPTSVSAISSSGGTSQPITVLSTAPWSATISTTNGVVATLTQSSGVNGGTFAVTFPQLRLPNVSPVATVTVKIDGTNVEQTMNFTQQKLPTRSLNFVSMGTHWGELANTTLGTHNRWTQYSLLVASKFGPSGVVYMPTSYSIKAGGGNSTAAINTDLAYNGGTDIYNIGARTLSAANGQIVKTWYEGSDKRVFIFVPEIESSTATFTYLGIGTSQWQLQSSAGITFTINPAYNVTNNALYRFLFRDGPFTNGTDITSAISLKGGDGSESVVKPPFDATMVPLILHPSVPGAMILGIDPVKRVLVCTDGEIFSHDRQATNWTNPANQQFLDNLNAWITYTAMYGDAWTDQFK